MNLTPTPASSPTDSPDSPDPRDRVLPTVASFSTDPMRRAAITTLKARLTRPNAPVSPAHHILYNLLRGLDPRRGFATPRRRGAVTHEAFHWGAAAAVHAVSIAEGISLTPSMSHALREASRQAAVDDFNAARDQGEGPGALKLALIRAMRLTPHGEVSDTYLHGVDTWARYRKLCSDIRSHSIDRSADLPAWLHEYGAAWLDRQVDPVAMREYLVHHDCGKPFVMSRDAEGRRHFPGHAEASAKIWAQAGGSALACELMAKDMRLHTCTPDEAASMADDPLTPSLLFAALAELQSNAESVFGGIDSTSYKIKLKALTRRANALIRAWAEAELEAV